MPGKCHNRSDEEKRIPMDIEINVAISCVEWIGPMLRSIGSAFSGGPARMWRIEPIRVSMFLFVLWIVETKTICFCTELTIWS